MPGKPKIEEGNRYDRQQQCDPNWQTNPEIQNKIDDYSKEGGNAVINGENREQKIPWLSLIWIPAFWASIERHKPILQRANVVPRYEYRALAAGWTFPPQRITNHPKKTTDGIIRFIRLTRRHVNNLR